MAIPLYPSNVAFTPQKWPLPPILTPQIFWGIILLPFTLPFVIQLTKGTKKWYTYILCWQVCLQFLQDLGGFARSITTFEHNEGPPFDSSDSSHV